MAAASRRTDSTKTLLLIAAVVGVIAVLGVGVALLVGGDGGGDDDTADETVGLANCAAASTDTASEGTTQPPELADFPADDINKPVAVEGTPLPEFSREVQAGAADPVLCLPAPVVVGYDYDGNQMTIDPASDGPTMVVLLAHWCPHCNAEIPVLNSWRDSGGIPEGLNIVGVSTGVSSDAPNYPPDEWLVEKDWQWPVFADDVPPDGSSPPPAMGAFGGTSYPTLIFIDGDGLVRRRLSGEMPIDDFAPLAEELVTG